MRILVFQHVATEHPGSFREVMAARGAVMTQIELDEGEAIPPPAGFDALLVMGGPMDVWEEEEFPWLIAEKRFIRDWVTAGGAYLGMCLGAQLLASSCGGETGKMAMPDIGMRGIDITPDPLFDGVPRPCPGFEWHGAEVKRLPPSGRLLAASAACPIEAFAIGRFAYGLQFHLELSETSAADWAQLPAYEAALERALGPGALAALQEEVTRGFPPLHDAARRIFGNFLDIAAAAGTRA